MTYVPGTRVKSISDGPLGVLDPDDRRAFLDDVWVNRGDVGTVVAELPEGWLYVEFDGKGHAPVSPDMVSTL